MTKFKVGDRVRVYQGDTETYSGTVTCTPPTETVLVASDVDGHNHWAHVKQCRKIVKKKKPQAEHRHEGYPGVATIDGGWYIPCPVPGCDWGKGKYDHRHESHTSVISGDTLYYKCPVENCSWGKDKAVPDNATGRKSEDHRGASSKDVPQGRSFYADYHVVSTSGDGWSGTENHKGNLSDCKICNPTPKPAPRECRKCGSKYED